ncbi:hypothetical protein, partial [Hymenobacter agri]
MKQRFLSTFFSLLLGLLSLSLGSCSLYHKVVHPYRLPTPKPSKQFIAQQKAEKKAKEAREKEALANSGQQTGLFGGLLGGSKKKSANADGTPEAATDVSTPSGAPLASATPATPATSTMPERSTVRYDKHQMMKKPKLNRRKIHKQRKGFHPIDSIHNFFKFGLHAKPNYSPDHRPAPKQPKGAPDDAVAPDNAPGGPP